MDAGFIDCSAIFIPTQKRLHLVEQLRWSRARVGWRIDYFFVSPQLKAHDRYSIHQDVMGSDQSVEILLNL